MPHQTTNRHRRQILLWLVVMNLIATLVGSTTKRADAGERPTLVVRIDNLVAVSAENLRVAEARAAEVFARAGVGVRWMDEDAVVRHGIRPPFTIVLVRGTNTAKSSVLATDALGLADLQVRRAHVFYDRIEALNVRSLRSAASVLGDVIAHELGHLVLSRPTHSADGIMRAGVETRLRALETFTHAEARDILSHLRQVLPMQMAEAACDRHGL